METGSGDDFRKALALVKEKKGEFEALKKERESTEQDCEHFGIASDAQSPAAGTLLQLRETFAGLEKELAAFEDMWGVYEEWAGAEGLEKFAKEDWISFRSRYFGFEEFLLKWIERVRKLGQLNGVTMRILKDAERYKVLLLASFRPPSHAPSLLSALQEFFPVLKWVRGEPLSPENWIELFRIVKLPPATTLEKLTFGDLLAVADEISKNVTVLKVRARARAQVRARAHGYMCVALARRT